MAFTPILTAQSISYATSRNAYRNASREAQWGTPVFFYENTSSGYGFGGPKYRNGYNYNNSPETHLGNCTWWCASRLLDALNKRIPSVGSNDAVNWYAAYSGDKSTNADNIKPGDIIVFSDSDVGHVMFVESVDGNNIHISHSAWSTRSVWSGKSCLVGTFTKSEIAAGNSVDMYRGSGASAHYVTVVGVLHTGEEPGPGPGPEPEPGEEELTIVLTNEILKRRKLKSVRIIL